jgi:hypothetical protein
VIGRNVVLKVPASADGIELQVSIHAVQNDNLGKTFQLLNSDDFKQPLQLAPVALGQALCVANLIKKTFTGVEEDPLYSDPSRNSECGPDAGPDRSLALVEPSDEERLALSTYIDDLSRAGLQFGINLDATTLSSDISRD